MPDFTTAHPLESLLRRLAGEPAVLVEVQATEGSVPREAGAWMAVFQGGEIGTIGGGHLEWDAIAEARSQLASNTTGVEPRLRRVVLGPSLGQCCGGAVTLRYQRIEACDAAAIAARLMQHRQSRLKPVALFGGGHVGHALVRVLAPLPFALTWIDSRDGVFPDPLP